MTKRAIAIGINYTSTPQYKLNGCHNDARNIVNFLLNNGYDNSNIRLLLEPTKLRILDNLNWIVNNSVAGDIVFISYSGHGTQINDTNGDERDGKDECIFTANLQLVTDDELSNILSKAKPNVNIVCFFDGCHSGSMLDLTHNWIHRQDNRFSYTIENLNKHLANITCISGCKDDQISLEVNNQGLLTTAFVRHYKIGIHLHTLLRTISEDIKKNSKQSVQVSSTNNNLSQDLNI